LWWACSEYGAWVPDAVSAAKFWLWWACSVPADGSWTDEFYTKSKSARSITWFSDPRGSRPTRDQWDSRAIHGGAVRAGPIYECILATAWYFNQQAKFSNGTTQLWLNDFKSLQEISEGGQRARAFEPPERSWKE